MSERPVLRTTPAHRAGNEPPTLREADAAYLAELRRATVTTLGDLIGHGSEVALLDAPNQRNVGDSLIWAGELAYFRRLGLKVTYVADLRGYVASDLRRAMPSGTILIHGGGNFGDLWLGHQTHRERIVQDFPDYRVVQLPQSVWFGSPERAAVADTIIGAHPDFTLLLRDQPSAERSSADLPHVESVFCPDLALGWDPPMAATGSSSDRVLVIAREDKESSSGLLDVGREWIAGASADVTDWHHTGWDAQRWQLARWASKLHHHGARVRRRVAVPRLPGADARVQRTLVRINDLNVVGGIRLFSPAKGAVVDRLHAHILATLLGIEHVLLDNSYGKLRAIYDGYTGRFSTAHYATSLDEARELAARFGGA
jgi:exopolysaccharide biosynthesis predicted pyruvyltransferase EpsI